MTRVTLRLPDELHQRLRVASQKAGTSLNQLIVTALNETVDGEEEAGREKDSLMEQVRHIRTILGDLVVEIDPSQFPPEVRPRPGLPKREELMKLLPRLNPPLSATLAEEREDRI